MMKIFLFTVCLLIFFSCKQFNENRFVKLVEVPTVYNWKGHVKEYKFDKKKKKVINYLGKVGSLRNILEHTDRGKIDRIIRENPDFQFVFYIDRVVPADTVAFKELMLKYRCAFPVILDFKDEFYKANKNRLIPENDRYSQIGYICDKDCYIYEISVIGTRQSFFDEMFRKAKRQMR